MALALLTLSGLRLCQIHSTGHGMEHAGGWEACGIPSALGPSNQAFLWDLEQAWPWRKRSVTENCSRRRHPSPGSSHGGRQCFPGRWEQRRLCGVCRVLSAAHGVRWAPGVPPLHPAGVPGGRCPPVRRHTRPCRRTRVFRQGWMLSRSSQRFKLSGCRSLGTVIKTSQNTFQMEIKTRMKWNKP